MSDVLFPELPGLEWDLTKTPIFNTKIMTSVNGRELRASYQAVPRYEFTMSFAFLRENKGRNELQQLESFFLDRRGSFDSFLYKMPEDNQFECNFVGDGVSTSFQIYKSIGSTQVPTAHTQSFTKKFDLNMWNKSVSKKMWDSNVEKAMWNSSTATVSKDGIYILTKPVEAGIEFSISGTFYYRCRFKDDAQEYTNFMHKLWKAGKFELIGSLGNKV